MDRYNKYKCAKRIREARSPGASSVNIRFEHYQEFMVLTDKDHTPGAIPELQQEMPDHIVEASVLGEAEAFSALPIENVPSNNLKPESVAARGAEIATQTAEGVMDHLSLGAMEAKSTCRDTAAQTQQVVLEEELADLTHETYFLRENSRRNRMSYNPVGGEPKPRQPA